MDYSDDQKLMKGEARRFLEARCATARVRAVLGDAARDHDAELWTGIAAQGWMGVAIPEAHGGLGLGHVELCAIAEELGRACAPVPFASTIYGVAEALMLFGSDAQRARWLPRIAAGEVIGALATSEGPGPLAAHATNTRVTGDRLSGEKIPVTDGAIADLFVVLASDGLYLVERRDGVASERLRTLDDSRGAARVQFSEVSAERLGQECQRRSDWGGVKAGHC